MIDNKGNTNYKKLHYLIDKLELEFPVADLARKTGYAEPTISPYVSGKIKPSTKFIQKICEVYEVDLRGFKDESENKYNVSEPQISTYSKSQIDDLFDDDYFLGRLTHFVTEVVDKRNKKSPEQIGAFPHLKKIITIN